jgi:hypothetical protein
MDVSTANVVTTRPTIRRMTAEDGLKGGRCQCGFCGQMFRSLSAFERHQIRPRKNASVGCLNEQGMRQRGMVQNAEGLWTTGAFTKFN